ncbi:MAG: hypothetical protein JJ900_00545 [Rhodospirillales bacterium]|nr:hypothetical protein [Rhodospirillales bacterium]MBO6785305.1 hypothetical protein [Rhodospirillales bacterium]
MPESRLPSLILRLSGVFCVLLALSACSSVKLAYGLADNALESRAERYLDLDAADERHVQEEVARLVAWHRTAMLPRYAAFLHRQAAVTDKGPWQPGDVENAFAEFRGLLDETVAGAAPYIASVLARHTASGKIDHLEAQMAAYIGEERLEEQAPFDDLLAERVERRVDNLERFIGPLRDDQIEIVRWHTRPTVGDRLVWLDHLEKRQRALTEFLRSDPASAPLAAFVYKLALRGYDIVDPSYGGVSEARWRKLEALYADVLASLSDDQRFNLAATLRSYADDIMDLAAGE